MTSGIYNVRCALPHEFLRVGQLMVAVYSRLEGFPNKKEQPDYYRMLANIGEQTNKPNTELLVCVMAEGIIGGAVVYFSDMAQYGSGGTATKEINASGFRLLAVDPKFRGNGIGKLLTKACIQKAISHNNTQVIIHSTEFMRIAWEIYINIGFERSEDLDFMQGELPVYGFRLQL
ncbi:GNAT family N-acetyltransferase [Flavobacteriales bacterium 34_180_T64]|nr:GNAT family N-acetyltransferase [Flavobacteriales bacterium 34_180_T64]